MIRSRLVGLALLALLALGSPAGAAPKTAEAKAEFDRGVAAYQNHDYAGAAEALNRSFALEADPETLYAWAQAERQLDRCDKAIELYRKLLAFNLPAENKAVIRSKLDECKDIIAAQKPEPPPQPPPARVVEPRPAQAAPATPPRGEGGRSRWKDPIGGTLVGVGAIGTGVGVWALLASRAAHQDMLAANRYDDFVRYEALARSRATLGVIATATGGAILVSGVLWYATRGGKREHVVTGWLSPSGGGLAAAGRF